MLAKKFTKMSILFQISYWKELKVPQNIDVMHIEKNTCESSFGTLLNIDGKTKDTTEAQEDMNIEKINT